MSDSLAPLVRGQLDVILHPDIDHVPRGAHNAPAAPRHGGHGQTLPETDLLPIGRHALLGHLVDGEPSGGVGQLSEKGGRQTVVEGENSVIPKKSKQ